MTVITTSTAAAATALTNQRKVDRCQNGVLWSMFWDGTNTTTTSMDFYYSTDDGATWAKGGEFGFAGTGTTYTPNGSLFIDLDDYAHVVYKDRHSGYLYYRRGTPNAGRTSWTWSAAVALSTAATYLDQPDVIAHRESAGWAAHVVCSSVNGTTNLAYWRGVVIANDGTTTLMGAGFTALGGSYGNSNHVHPSLDWNHNGDGKTVRSGENPDVYAAWSAGAAGSGKGVRFKKATYSGGSWTWGTEREIDSTRYQYEAGGLSWLNCLFDGTRVIIGGLLLGSGYQVMLYERDRPDTTTTTRVLLTGITNPNYLARGSMTYDQPGNVFLFGRSHDGAAGTRPLNRRRWDRSTETLGAIETFDSSGNDNPYISSKRGHSGNRAEWVYADGTGSPYSIAFGSLGLNAAPNAPILTAPADGSSIDRTSTNRFDWDFSDPDAGDSQSAYNLRYRMVGAGTWTETGWTSTPNTYHDAAAGTFTDATDYEWQVATKDAQGVEGPFSASSFFTAATAPASPTITDPINGATISSSHTVVWSTPDQASYQLRRVADNAGAPDTGTVYYDSGEVTSTSARARSLTFETNDRYEHVQVRVKDKGLWSTWTSVRVHVSYTPPPVPVVTLTPDAANGNITVGITNPAPGAGVPATSYNDVYIDDENGEERKATMLAPNASWTYWTPRSGRDYDGAVRVVAVGENGTTASS